MAEERTITTVFKADISNFSASTQQLNRYVAQVNAEFKNSTASMGKWNDNATGLQAKITQLTKVHDAESKKLKELEAEYNKLTDEQKKNTKQGQQLATAINEQSAKVKETKKNIDYYTDSLKELNDAGVETREELDKINKELEEQKQAAKDLGGGISKGVAIGIAGIGAACVGAFASIKSIVDETKELRTQLGMLETSFAEAGLGVEASKDTFNELYSVLGDNGKATEASLQLAQIAKTEKELTDYTNILTGVYATFGDSLPVEGLAEAMNHTAKLGSVQGNLADALEWAGINVDDFNAQLETLTTEEERAAYINETLNGLYGETATKYKEVNAEVIAANDAQNQYNQAMAEVGEKAQPVITKFQATMADMLLKVLPPFSTALSWVIDNLDILVPIIGSVTAGIVAQNAATKIKTITDLAASQGISVMTLAQKGLNAAFKANPIGLVVTAIGLLVTAFVTLWNKCESFRNFWKGFINVLIGGVNALIKGLNKLKINIPDWVPEFGGKSIGFNIPLIPKLAKGGVVDKATLAMIGEQGKEVVMPLENNTQWIDKLADKISTRTGNQSNTYNITNTFERMETSRHALHKANLETRRILKEV